MSKDQNTSSSSDRLDLNQTFFVWNASKELADEENSVVKF
jgi:hypothetical protein